jgi:hypothetical protein
MTTGKPSARRGRRVSAVQKTHETIHRVNRPVAGLIETVLVSPQEFSQRIRDMIHRHRSPQRAIRCLDLIEADLARRGITMRSYFAALRKSAARAVRAKA